MKAGIIAAGEGSRLKSGGISVPKPLVPVDGVPLIQRLLLSLKRCGISEVVCIVNEYSLEVKQFVEDLRLEVPVEFVVKTTPSSMHSLFALAPHLIGGQFLLSTVDSIFHEEELTAYLEHARGRGSIDGILAVTNFIDDENPLYVRMGPSKQILEFGGKDIATESGWVTGGLYVFSPKVFNEMDAMLSQGKMRLRYFLGHLARKGYSFEGFPFSRIVDVDRIHDVEVAEALLRGHA